MRTQYRASFHPASFFVLRGSSCVLTSVHTLYYWSSGLLYTSQCPFSIEQKSFFG